MKTGRGATSVLFMCALKFMVLRNWHAAVRRRALHLLLTAVHRLKWEMQQVIFRIAKIRMAPLLNLSRHIAFPSLKNLDGF